MKKETDIPEKRIDALYEKLDKEAEVGGYHLNPDRDFTKALVRGLIVNEDRFGYMSCPCRLATGDREEDLDIICPCDYRDADLNDWGACYCALYVSREVLDGKRELSSIPERRPADPSERTSEADTVSKAPSSGSGMPVWRCRVCGYLCARDQPPEVCPICKVGRDRFEVFWSAGQ